MINRGMKTVQLLKRSTERTPSGSVKDVYKFEKDIEINISNSSLGQDLISRADGVFKKSINFIGLSIESIEENVVYAISEGENFYLVKDFKPSRRLNLFLLEKVDKIV